MTIIVQKFGGTSVSNLACIEHVANKIVKSKQQGHNIVVVVSAMEGETDRLESMAYQLSKTPDPRELDVLLSSGEQVSIALLSMALIVRGLSVRSYTGSQIPIYTNCKHNEAQIERVETKHIRADFAEGKVVVVAGFQGITEKGDITTLGRGGSDTTAVAIAAALQADECQIFTDVSGVYTTDPQLVPEAKRFKSISIGTMRTLSDLGAKVLQFKAVEYAKEHQVPLRVMSTFEEGPGTQVVYEQHAAQDIEVVGIACQAHQVKCVFKGLVTKMAGLHTLCTAFQEVGIEITMMLERQLFDHIERELVFHRRHVGKVDGLLEHSWEALGVDSFDMISELAKISLVGSCLDDDPGLESLARTAITSAGIEIKMAVISPIKVSLLISDKKIKEAVGILHQAFDLGATSKEDRMYEKKDRIFQ